MQYLFIKQGSVFLDFFVLYFSHVDQGAFYYYYYKFIIYIIIIIFTFIYFSP